MSSALARLIARPRRFRFDAGMRVLMRAASRADPAEAATFHAPLGTGYPGADIEALRTTPGGKPAVITPVMALTGPTGVLPRLYDEVLLETVRQRSRAMRDFFDLVGQRFVGHFARAGTKYRVHRAAEQSWMEAARPGGSAVVWHDPATQVLLALTGYATPHLVPRLGCGGAPLLHYAGLVAMRPRSADRLAALLSDWLGRPVEVVQFVGDWLDVPEDQRTRLPRGRGAGTFNRLGVDAALGVRAWDIQARIVLRVGPLDGTGFAAMLPDRDLLRRLVALVRSFLGFETGFAVNPVIAAAAIPLLRLDGAMPARLGWTTWLPMARRRTDAADAVFAAETVEAEQARDATTRPGQEWMA